MAPTPKAQPMKFQNMDVVQNYLRLFLHWWTCYDQNWWEAWGPSYLIKVELEMTNNEESIMSEVLIRAGFIFVNGSVEKYCRTHWTGRITRKLENLVKCTKPALTGLNWCRLCIWSVCYFNESIPAEAGTPQLREHKNWQGKCLPRWIWQFWEKQKEYQSFWENTRHTLVMRHQHRSSREADQLRHSVLVVNCDSDSLLC